METMELLLTSIILKRSREMRNSYQGKSDWELIDIAIKEIADHHKPVMEKLKAALS